MNQITIRTLNKNDLNSVAHVHIRAFSNRPLAQLGQRAVHRYYEWQLVGPHDAVALGIFRGEHLAGYCFAGVFRGTLSGYLRKNRKFLAWRVITHPWLIATPLFRNRMYLAWTVLRDRPVSPASRPIAQTKSFGLLAFAIDPQIQGAGLGKRLMAEIERIAIEQGFSHMHLTVDINNTQAIAFYEKLGWQKHSLPDSSTWRGAMAKDLVAACE